MNDFYQNFVYINQNFKCNPIKYGLVYSKEHQKGTIEIKFEEVTKVTLEQKGVVTTYNFNPRSNLELNINNILSSIN